MATPEAQLQALMQEVTALRQEVVTQRQEQQQELARVRQESAQRLQEVTQAAMAAQGNLQMVPTAIQEMGQALRNVLQDQNKELVEAMKKETKGKDKLCLVDTKGLGKPSTFSGEAEQFLPWRHRMTSYICSVYPDLREVLEWCEEREKSITGEELRRAFGDAADALDQVPDLDEKSRELASALQMVTQREPFAIVVNCATNGLEAWRRLSKRYDPATASRKRTMLKTVISPQKQKLETLPQAIEEWMDAVRTYEKRKDSTGQRAAISDEIKMAALEAMLPQELESHVQLNQARFATFDDLMDEITRFVEHKTGKSLKLVSAASSLANQGALGDPMDVSSVGYKGAGAKGKTTKFLGACHHCGKTGHKAADCWAKSKGPGAKGTSSKGPGNNNQYKGKSKGAKGGSKGSKGKGQEGEWKESNGLLLGGLEVEEPETPKGKRATKAKPVPPVTKPVPPVKAFSIPYDPNSLSDADAAVLEQTLQAGLAALQARAKARPPAKAGVVFPKHPPPPRPKASQDASSSARPEGTRKVAGSARPAEPMRPPPKKATDGSKRPPEPKVPPKKGPVGPPPKAPKSKPRAKGAAVAKMFKTRSEWGRMRFRERIEHLENVRKHAPKGSVGQSILKKQGPACTTCTVRRKISTAAAKAYIAAKAKAKASKSSPVAKVSSSGLARHVLKREGLLKNPGERRKFRIAEAKKKLEEEDDADPSEGGESVEPEGSEQGESEPPEVDSEVEEAVETKSERSFEEVEVEEEPTDAPSEPVKGSKGAKGLSKGSSSVAGQTGASPVVAKSDAGMTMSSSSAMHNLLVGSLSTTNTEHRERIRARLEVLKKRSEEDGLAEDEQAEAEALQEELERLDKEAEDLQSRGRVRAAPKAVLDRLSQSHHDARYRAAVAKGVSHARAWKAEKARRRSALHRKEGVKNRAAVHVRMTESWTRHFREEGVERPEDRQDTQREDEPNLPTVVVDKHGNEVAPSSSSMLRPLTRKERTYYREEEPEELKPSAVPAVYTKGRQRSEKARKQENRKRAETPQENCWQGQRKAQEKEEPVGLAGRGRGVGRSDLGNLAARS